jgi:3-deoxy-manno-octulosonate cytidylyltransferase (CMP-KDO synthetase)
MIDDQTIVIIPARYASTRFPGKPLQPLKGPSGEAKPLIQWTYEAACRVPGVDAVFVATDSQAIAEAADGFGAKVVMTAAECRNGTERCADALTRLPGCPRLVVNVQGDAPLTPPDVVAALIERAYARPDAAVCTPAIRCSLDQLERLEADARRGIIGGTTVACADDGRALYFSKQIIPHLPASARQGLVPMLMHIGVYAYMPASLKEYARRSESQLERLEGLEQLRFLDFGARVEVVSVPPPPWLVWELNNASDIAIVEKSLAHMLKLQST